MMFTTLARLVPRLLVGDVARLHINGLGLDQRRDQRVLNSV
jgi:hypothetical protein